MKRNADTSSPWHGNGPFARPFLASHCTFQATKRAPIYGAERAGALPHTLPEMLAARGFLVTRNNPPYGSPFLALKKGQKRT